MRKVVFLLVVLVCSTAGFGQDATQGSLFAVGKQGKELGTCPLKNTSVKVDISGFLARVRVEQEFVNSFAQPIEAVYVFPLSQNGAVDDMTMTIGDRVIRGKIMKREEARETYEAAKSEGKTASLLDQERPNIFTQSVANIMPGERVMIEISYVETLKYDDGAYEFVFPMTVGPRYVPGGVRDAGRISPPVAKLRNGSDISIEVNVNAGVPIEEIRSSSHAINQLKATTSISRVILREGKTIPNKDFILRYDVTGKRIEDAVLTHRDGRGGFFTMILQPPDKIATDDRTPKEIVFVLDTSGSMEGFPIEKAKEAMLLSLDGLYPDDTFNLITFAGDTEILFDKPVPATRANLDRAQAFLSERNGSGGTEMMKAIKTALEPSDVQDHLRIVCFMTDGYVGNENEIIAEVQRHPNARVFSFGIGSSVNRHLLDKIAEVGNGEAEYVALEDDGSKAARRFYERVRTPLLTDLSVDWNGMPVSEIYPGKLTDLFSAKPVILHGRYDRAASGTIKLKGKVAGQPYERDIAFYLPEGQSANDVLATLWARTRIDDISKQALNAANKNELDKQITDLGLQFRLMSEFTSFVAVEDRIVNQNGIPIKVEVPVAVPAGTSPEDDGEVTTVASAGKNKARNVKTERKAYKTWRQGDVGYITTKSRGTVGGGRGSGSGRGTGSGTGNGNGNGSGVGYNRGSGTGIGNGSAPAATPLPSVSAPQQHATVNVTGSSTAEIVSSNISTRQIQGLPKTASFSSLLALTPGTARKSMGGFQVDGTEGDENTFIIDGSQVVANGGDVGQLNGRAVLAVRPVYPAAARVSRALGDVAVAIETDLSGNVVSAKAVSGHTQLRAAAEKAAMLSRFAPTFAAGRAVRIGGKIVYSFRSAKTVKLGLREMRVFPVSAEDRRAITLGEKLHFWLTAIIERLHRGDQKITPNESRFVRSDKAEIQVELTAPTPAILEKLRAAGFELASEKGKTLVLGRVAIEKLEALAAIEEVKLILPKI